MKKVYRFDILKPYPIERRFFVVERRKGILESFLPFLKVKK